MATLTDLLSRTVDLATESVASGGGPFGALVAEQLSGRDRWRVVAEGINRVVPNLDPTAHAEVVALRAAAQALGRFDLAGTVLLTSCEPCPMCLAAGLWARVDAMWFAATRDDAAAAGFDDREFYTAFDTPREEWAVPVLRADVAHPLAPFQAWTQLSDRVAY